MSKQSKEDIGLLREEITEKGVVPIVWLYLLQAQIILALYSIFLAVLGDL